MGLRTSRLLARSGRAPLVVPIEAASFCDLDDIAVLGSLHGSRRRAVHGEGAVAAPAMVVLEVIDKESPHVPLAENDDVVQALAADGSDDSLRVGFCQGLRGAVSTSSIPMHSTRILNAGPYTRSRSRIRKRGGASQGNASDSCWAVHCAVGCSVTLKCTTRRRA